MATFDSYINLLSEFIKFKSVSTDPQYKKDIESQVGWLLNVFKENSFSVKTWTDKKINPVVFASFMVNPKAETILIYGHYDVQPAEKVDGWNSEPFSLRKTKERLYARGVIDNKGQVLIHMATVFDLIKDKKLKYNIKFMLEGNEETGNVSLAGMMRRYKSEAKCNVVVVSDGELTNNQPTIEVSLRGGFNCTLKYISAKNNLHSGLVGGGVPNSAIELSKFVSRLYNQDGSIAYPKFYNGVDKPSSNELKNNKNLVKQTKSLTTLFGVKSLLLPKSTDFYTQTGLSSTIQITGFKSGYIESGYLNIVPSTAEVKLNFRLAASQDPQAVLELFKKQVKSNTPKYINYDLEFDGIHSPVKVSTDNEYVKSVTKILKKVYKTEVNKRNVGGAIPFVGDVKKILGVDTVLIPLVNEDCNMHGANENFDIALAKKALEFSRVFFSK